MWMMTTGPPFHEHQVAFFPCVCGFFVSAPVFSIYGMWLKLCDISMIR